MQNITRWILAGVAILVVATAGIYIITGGDDESSAADDNDAPFGGTPLPDLPGQPTPVPGTGPIGAERPELGQPAPDFALVDAFDDSVVRKLSDFEGTPVVLNWYASWCEPCKNELPLYQRASEQLHGQVAFFAVNLFEEKAEAQGILEELGVTFPAVLDANGAVTDRWRVFNMPTTYFIDADGTILAHRIGEVTESELQARLAEMGITYSQ